MGWLSLRSRLHGPTSFEPVPTQFTNFKSATEHVEHVEHIYAPRPSEYPLQNPSVPDDALPFIPPAIVRNQRLRLSQAQGLAWIVVDNIVYDCTKFIKEHPGGDTVIRSFIGEDCSWQFGRFHSKAIMEKWGRPLRVGRTEGIVNRFKEPPRYFGSKSR
jgi:cytochrome b involved in lipid metabolism